MNGEAIIKLLQDIQRELRDSRVQVEFITSKKGVPYLVYFTPPPKQTEFHIVYFGRSGVFRVYEGGGRLEFPTRESLMAFVMKGATDDSNSKETA